MLLRSLIKDTLPSSAAGMLRETGLRILQVACEFALVAAVLGSLWMARLLIEHFKLPDPVGKAFEYFLIFFSVGIYLRVGVRTFLIAMVGRSFR